MARIPDGFVITLESDSKSTEVIIKAERELVMCKNCANRPRLNIRGTTDYNGDCPCASTGDPYYDYVPDDEWYCANGVRMDSE